MDVEATRRVAQAMLGRKVHDSSGERVGEIVAVYHDDRTLELEWVAVRTGFFGTHTNLVPYDSLAPSADDYALPYAKSVVRDAPATADDGRVSPEEELLLRRHYAANTPAAAQLAGTHATGAAAAGTPSVGIQTETASTTTVTGTSPAGGSVGETPTLPSTKLPAPPAPSSDSLTRRLASELTTNPGVAAAAVTAPSVTMPLKNVDLDHDLTTTTGGTEGTAMAKNVDIDLTGDEPTTNTPGLAWGTMTRRQPITTSSTMQALSTVTEQRGLIDRPAQDLVLREERVRVEKERREIGRVQLRRYIVTEKKMVEVEVKREEIRLVRVPANDVNPTDGDLGETIVEYTMYEDYPVIVTEVASVERVSMVPETIVEKHTVEAETRREDVEIVRRPRLDN